ncbi:hypothetical protein L0P88_18940 [Muricauda sp. SCSIO 64092]|uniref:hypothetical protein n=1 Tax=Allomuricauda sp. SCSIO 64092 TaxID=2908842 RepID=UPI001FF306A4|nr:hypothetical protein [Muricauda sp. SCSIO 64092]UOY05999.1 hypothetical protein L0P88_18940 [Muricauda sp. SCSIO 64092]
MKLKKKIELGDLFELETSKGKAYLQFVKYPKDTSEVEKIKVFYSLFQEEPKSIEKMVVSEDYFYLDFPLKAAHKKNIVSFVGNVALDKEFSCPKYYRTENPFGEGWHIVNSETWERESVETLTEEQKKLSPWGVWNDTLLIEKLENNWRLYNWI